MRSRLRISVNFWDGLASKRTSALGKRPEEVLVAGLRVISPRSLESLDGTALRRLKGRRYDEIEPHSLDRTRDR
jgi:hypothetical protein